MCAFSFFYLATSKIRGLWIINLITNSKVFNILEPDQNMRSEGRLQILSEAIVAVNPNTVKQTMYKRHFAKPFSHNQQFYMLTL